jgi:hypothetical protein
VRQLRRDIICKPTKTAIVNGHDQACACPLVALALSPTVNVSCDCVATPGGPARRPQSDISLRSRFRSSRPIGGGWRSGGVRAASSGTGYRQGRRYTRYPTLNRRDVNDSGCYFANDIRRAKL